jgi:hypothetical protein
MDELEERVGRELGLLDDPEVKARYEENLRRIREELRPLIESLKRSRILTAKDYMITINSPPVRYR